MAKNIYPLSNYIPCCQKFQFQTLKSQRWDTLRQKYVNTKDYHHYYKMTNVLPKSNEYLSFYIQCATKIVANGCKYPF